MTVQEFKMPPRDYQLAELREHGSDEGRCIFWEQGTGKTKETIDQIAAAVRAGTVLGAIVIAPGGVERNWVTVEYPDHMPDDVAARMRTHVWSTAKKSTKPHKEAVEALLKHLRAGKPILLTMSYDALLTEAGSDLVREILLEAPMMMVGDETARIKNDKALRTKTMIAAGKHARMRRALTGTPILNRPFDVYSQVRFADNDFWKRKGIASAYAFRQRFGVWRKRMLAGGRQFEELVGYRDLDVLEMWLKEISSRVNKDVLNLPSKIYKRRTFELTAEQRKMYDTLRGQFLLELENGDVMTADMAIVRMLRLQQITCGYLPSYDENGDVAGATLLAKNPRLELLKEILEDEQEKTIIWARFTQDIDQIVAALAAEHGPESVVRYDGKTDETQRAAAVEAFQRGSARFFVATAATAGEGLTLHAAKLVIYYSNSFKLGERLQSEDRAHRMGMGDKPVVYIDLIAEETVDTHILANLMTKQKIGAQVLSEGHRGWMDSAREWLADTTRVAAEPSIYIYAGFKFEMIRDTTGQVMQMKAVAGQHEAAYKTKHAQAALQLFRERKLET